MSKKRGLLWLVICSYLFFFNFLPTAQAANDQKVVDQANLFSADETTTLKTQIQQFIDKTGMDAVVLTINDATGKSTRDYAADFYDYNGYGFGKHFDGFIFLIDMDNREFYIVTTGKTKALLSDKRIDSILDAAETEMLAGYYANAAKRVLEEVTAFNDEGMPNGYSYDATSGELYKEKGLSGLEWGIAFLGGLIASIILYVSVSAKYNLKKTDYQYPYQTEGELTLTQQSDQLYDVRLTRRRIPKPPTNSGGGGFTGSSGRSHGGGGRSF